MENNTVKTESIDQYKEALALAIHACGTALMGLQPSSKEAEVVHQCLKRVGSILEISNKNE